MTLQTPVLFLLYNRPETSKVVFAAIRETRPSQLFVAADGPSERRERDFERCEETRSLISSVDWECEVKTLYRDENLGCRKAISSAISWFYEHVEQGIILEDDCLPSQSFFRYCQDLLEYYKSDERVMAISGDNFQDGRKVTNDSYYFSRYPHCWGWATWRRAWSKYDADMSGWPAFRAGQAFLDIGAADPVFKNYWIRNFGRVSSGEVDTWDSVWTYSCWSNGGLTALPVRNLVKNIGFGPDATHTTSECSKVGAMQAEDLQLPLRHPAHVSRHLEADHYTDTYHYNFIEKSQKTIVSRIVDMLKSFLG